MSIYLAEFVGTTLLIVFGGGVVAGVLLKESKAEEAGWLVISIAWGLAVSFAIYAVGEVSGAHINPAVTLSLAFIGDFEWAKVPGYMASQVAGGFVGAAIVWIHFLPHWKKTEDKDAKLAIFATGPAIRAYSANFVSEMIGTAVLIMGLLFIGTNEFTEGLNPLVVGGLILAIGLSLGATTGYAINPARDLGPRIAHFLLPIKGKGGSDWAYAWVPIVAPLLGGLLGASLYKMLFEQQIETSYIVVTIISAIAVVVAIIQDQKN